MVAVLLAVGGIAVIGGGIVLIVRLARKKPSAPDATRGTIPYKPEVTDWRGNRINENARVRQTHQEYTQVNRDAQAEYDAQRRAEEAARSQHEAEQDRILDELIYISQRLSTTTRDAAWKMNEITRKQIDAAASGKELDPATVKKIKDGFGKLAGGRIIGEDDIPSMPTDSQLFIRAYGDAFEEVCRNETALAVGVRTATRLMTGGASEIVFQSGKGFYCMRDYVEEGGESALGAFAYASFGAARDYAVGKLADKATKTIPGFDKQYGAVEKIYFDQTKRFMKQLINKVDKNTASTKNRAEQFINKAFE